MSKQYISMAQRRVTPQQQNDWRAAEQVFQKARKYMDSLSQEEREQQKRRHFLSHFARTPQDFVDKINKACPGQFNNKNLFDAFVVLFVIERYRTKAVLKPDHGTPEERMLAVIFDETGKFSDKWDEQGMVSDLYLKDVFSRRVFDDMWDMERWAFFVARRAIDAFLDTTGILPQGFFKRIRRPY